MESSLLSTTSWQRHWLVGGHPCNPDAEGANNPERGLLKIRGEQAAGALDTDLLPRASRQKTEVPPQAKRHFLKTVGKREEKPVHHPGAAPLAVDRQHQGGLPPISLWCRAAWHPVSQPEVQCCISGQLGV
eukprot:XP_028349251.1 uncharacterized protein LOC114486802 [Physeter catodon]